MRNLSLFLLALVLVFAGCRVKPPTKITVPGVGTVSSGSAVDLSALPAPLRYPGATATGSWTATTPKGQGTAYVFETADPLTKVTEYYKTAMPNWQSQSTVQTRDGTMLVSASPDEKEGMMTMVSTKDGKTNVVVTFWKNLQ